MTSCKCAMCIATLALMAFVCHAAIGASSDNVRATASAVTVDASGNDTSSIPDFDGDGTIGFGDFVKFAEKYGLGQGDDGYDVRFDLNGDGEIGFADLLIFAENFGKAAPSPAVVIPDANLRAAIERALGKGSGVPITQAELGKLDSLKAPLKGINDLTGLENAINLTELWLWRNNIADISPLAGLTNLSVLILWDNNIPDVSPLAGLTNLTHLELGANAIADISPLAGLTNLTKLWLNGNNIPDPSPLSGLTNLENLNLESSRTSELSALAGLTNLTKLILGFNGITDISPLAGLTNLTELWLYYNPITDISPLAGLTNLSVLILWDNNIPDVSPLAGLTNLTWLQLQNNPINDLSPLAELTNLTDLRLGHIKLPNPSTLASLLTGLTNLTHLNLYDTGITDISALAGLNNLTELWLGRNNIVDVLPLARLTNLTELMLNDNYISDVSPLEGLTSLTRLRLDINDLTDVSALGGLVRLTELNLGFNRITDISPLVGLTRLVGLDLRGNPLTDDSIDDHIPVLESIGAYVFFDSFKKGDYDIELVFSEAFSERQKNVLQYVARRWMAVISEDLPDYEFTQGWSGRCGDQSYEIPAGERIDDLRIYMTTFDVDDNPHAVGWGGPHVLREQTQLPVLGCMGFDLERANLLITGLHEIGHVLGFGTIWNDLGFFQNPPSGELHFNGPLAISAFDDAGGRDYPGAKVPLADPVHWKPGVLGNEVMVTVGGGALSAITVQSLADLGYGVDVSQADPHTLPGATSGAKIAVSMPGVPGVADDVFRPDIFTLSGADHYGQGSIEGRTPLGPADGGTGRPAIAEWMSGPGNTFDLARNQQVWDTEPHTHTAPELTCGAGLMNERIYVIDPQGRIVRTISR